EWCAPGVTPHRDDPQWRCIPYLEVGLERWHQVLSEDKPIAGRLDSFPEKEKAAFKLSDVRSILILPLMVDGRLYGLVGFDECLADRLWGSAEVEFLRSAARAISLAIERQEAVTALRESVEQYQSVFDTAASLIMSIDANGVIVDCNSRVKRILGYEPVDLIGQPLELIVPPSDHKQVYRHLQHAADHGCAYDRGCRLIRKDGRIIDIVINASALTDSRGEYTHSLCIIEDITERKQAEQALRDSEGLLRATVEATADGILVVNEKGNVIHANRRFAELWRIPAELIETRDDRRLLHFVLDQLRHADAFLAKVKELYDTSIEDFDTLYFKDGRVFERFSCPLTRNGRTAGRVWSFRDVTERTERENEIRKLSAVVEQSPNMIMITDPRGCIEYVNPRFSEVTGYAPEEVLGHKPSLLNSGRNDPALYPELWSTITGGRAWVGDVRNRRKDGGLYWEHKIITPVTDDSGNLIYYLAVGEDVTEQLQAREMLAEGQKMSAIGTLAAGVAHEFSNYLGGIIGNASHIIDEMNRDGGLLSVPESVQEISRLAEKANDIAVSLLSFSNARPEKTAPEDLKRIITRTLRLVRGKMHHDSVELTAHLDNVPPVNVSAGKMQHLLLNLLVNARQAIREQGTVTVSLLNKQDHIEIRVADTGSGIPAEYMNRIFDPFFSTRGVWGKDESPGIGMGLSICRNIAREYGGELTAESTEGRGSTFTLTLPVAAADTVTRALHDVKKLLVFTADKKISRAYAAAAAEIRLHVTCTDSLAEVENSLPDIADLVVCDAGFPAKGELYRLVSNCQQSAVPYVVINYGARDYQLEDIYDHALADYADIPNLVELMNSVPGCGREQKLT
ncbi:MAG: PAS domain S-box protein, partial [candidate division Zixibacteria bacterium]|nr:PAS domain S-box protein [candidate division Zixibacteria bacterium]